MKEQFANSLLDVQIAVADEWEMRRSLNGC